MKNCIAGIQQLSRIAALALAVPQLGQRVTAGQRAQSATAGEIRDPSTGAVWMLMRNTDYPGGPGRLVLVEQGSDSTSEAAPKTLLIHAGDRIVVEEHSAVADARLTAIALTSAAKGETLRARMTIGGGVVMVRAVATANAEYDPEANQ